MDLASILKTIEDPEFELTAAQKEQLKAVDQFFKSEEVEPLSESSYFRIFGNSVETVGARGRSGTIPVQIEENSKFQERVITEFRAQMEPEEYLKDLIREHQLRLMHRDGVQYLNADQLQALLNESTYEILREFAQIYKQTVPRHQYQHIRREVIAELQKLSIQAQKKELERYATNRQEEKKLLSQLKRFRLTRSETVSCFNSDMVRSLLSQNMLFTKEDLLKVAEAKLKPQTRF